jgi:GST-like protein
MTNPTDYTPPRVWTWQKPSGGTFASINRPIAGATHERALPVGRHPLQLYSLATPNGVKVTVMLEELLARGHQGAEYDAWLINIREGAQFSSGFVEVNPNSKIPALMDRSGPEPVRVFESGAILLYLAEKFGEFLPKGAGRAECLSWLFWQMGSAPYLLRDGGQARDGRAQPPPGRVPIPGRRRVHGSRHRRVALVRRHGQGTAVRRGRVPLGA